MLKTKWPLEPLASTHGCFEQQKNEMMVTVETELKVTECALDVHMKCMPFAKD